MNQNLKHSVRGALFVLPLLLPIAAHAHEDGDHKMDKAEWQQEMCSDRYAHAAGKLGYLQAKLGITEKQQDAWNKFYQSELDSAAKERDNCLSEKPMDRDSPPSVLDQEARLEKMLSDKLDALRASRPALEDLYKVLSTDQKDEFDQFGEAVHHHWKHGGEGMHGPHDGKPE